MPLSRAFVPSLNSRRQFVKQCVGIAAVTGLPLWFIEQRLEAQDSSAKSVSANDRPGVGLVGCGGQGRFDATNASAFGRIVAVCDVDDARAAEAAAQFTVEGRIPKRYSDFRRLLEDKNVDVIINGTPDHWHTLVNYGAVLAKKDVYSEKPLTLTIAEGRFIADAVKQSGIILQTGTQQRSTERFRLVCELVRNGRLGKLKKAEVFLPAGLQRGPFGASPIPAGFNWDYWLGQAPKTDYVRERAHLYFRYWYEYSGGTMTDWGAHHNDIAYWAIGLPAPAHVTSRRLSTPIPGGYSAYAEYAVNYRYENGVELAIASTRDDSISGEVLNPLGQRNGIRFVGTDGWIWVNREELDASDKDLLRKPLPEGAEKLYRSRNHMQNFFDCVRSRRAPICDAETGHRSATMCHLGAISLRTDKALTWDHAVERFVGEASEEANGYVAREMRAPYDYSFVR